MIRNILTLCVAVSLCGSVLAETASESDFQEFLDAWEGRWSGEFDQGNEKSKATAVCHRMPGDHALVAHVYTDGWSGVWMVMHDSNANRIRTLWSATNDFSLQIGLSSSPVYQVQDLAKEQRYRKAAKMLSKNVEAWESRIAAPKYITAAQIAAFDPDTDFFDLYGENSGQFSAQQGVGRVRPAEKSRTSCI